MDSHDYGHHASGYRKADGGPSKRFMRHLTVLAVVLVACLVWVMTHEVCRYPLENGICSLVSFIGVPIRLICLLEAEAGVE